jgi:hypothetical protein
MDRGIPSHQIGSHQDIDSGSDELLAMLGDVATAKISHEENAL